LQICILCVARYAKASPCQQLLQMPMNSTDVTAADLSTTPRFNVWSTKHGFVASSGLANPIMSFFWKRNIRHNPAVTTVICCQQTIEILQRYQLMHLKVVNVKAVFNIKTNIQT